MIVGEGGVAPEYFLYRMQWWEINRYLAGMQRRKHPLWETTRALQWWLTCMFSDRKKGSPPRHPEELYKFGWEENKPSNEPQLTEEEAADMQKMMDNFKW